MTVTTQVKEDFLIMANLAISTSVNSTPDIKRLLSTIPGAKATPAAPRPRVINRPETTADILKTSAQEGAAAQSVSFIDEVDEASEAPATVSPKPAVKKPGYQPAPAMSDVEKGSAVLVKGHEGEAIKEVQGLLTKAGYPVVQNGKLGTTTEGKIKHFQKDNQLSISGRIGQTTMKFLRAVADKFVQVTNAGRALFNTAKNVARQLGTVGYCYRGVAMSVARSTGLQLYGQSAYMADSQLRSSSKFKEVKNVSVNDLKKMPEGTVVVWDRAPASSGNRGRGGGWDHGHIAVLDGKGGEYSDHYRRNMFAPHYAGGGIKGVFVPV